MPSPLTAVHYGLMLVAFVFIIICVGTAMGALSNATKNKKKAKDQGLVAFAFCILGTVLLMAAKFIPA